MEQISMLQSSISQVLEQQGYMVQSNGMFVLRDNDRETRRRAHILAKSERMSAREKFILETSKIASKYFLDGKDLDVEKIEPKLLEIESGTEKESLFKWWNITWWSLPYEKAYGRQMRFIIWDIYHNTPIGLIGLQSPILSWRVRDEYLKITPEKRDYWINQSLSAQRLGALPPYNDILAGKLISMLMTADTVRKLFRKKYKNKKTLLKERELPPHLLFVTTTGAYGTSSVYNRLKFKDEYVAKYIGNSHGSGTFHIPNTLYEELVSYMEERGYNVGRSYGNGPSRKLRIIDQALQLLGFANGATHGIKRAVYLFPMVQNLHDVIHDNKKPQWNKRQEGEITEFWKKRWALPRAERNKQYLSYKGKDFLNDLLYNLEQYKKTCSVL